MQCFAAMPTANGVEDALASAWGDTSQRPTLQAMLTGSSAQAPAARCSGEEQHSRTTEEEYSHGNQAQGHASAFNSTHSQDAQHSIGKVVKQPANATEVIRDHLPKGLKA